MSHYEIVIKRCKRLEQMLERDFGASGRGLHDKVSSVSDRLPAELVKKMRFIATVRNNLVHESAGDEIDDVNSYKEACREAEAALNKLSGRSGRGKMQWIAVLFLLIILVTAALYYFR